MSFTFKEIKNLLRFKAQDNNAVKFSEYDVKQAVNEAIRYLSNALAAMNADFMERTYDYNEELMNRQTAAEFKESYLYEHSLEGVAEAPPMPPYLLHNFKYKGEELPEDFVSLVAVAQLLPYDGGLLTPCESARAPRHNEYKIVGNRIYCGSPLFRLQYRAALPEVKADEDRVNLPFTFKDAFVKLALMVLNNAETDIMEQAVSDAAQMLVPRRRYRNAHIKMPFMV